MSTQMYNESIQKQLLALVRYLEGVGPHSGLGIAAPEAYTPDRMAVIGAKIRHILDLIESKQMTYGLKTRAGDEVDYSVFISEYMSHIKSADWHHLLSKLHGLAQGWVMSGSPLYRCHGIRLERLWLIIYSLFQPR